MLVWEFLWTWEGLCGLFFLCFLVSLFNWLFNVATFHSYHPFLRLSYPWLDFPNKSKHMICELGGMFWKKCYNPSQQSKISKMHFVLLFFPKQQNETENENSLLDMGPSIAPAQKVPETANTLSSQLAGIGKYVSWVCRAAKLFSPFQSKLQTIWRALSSFYTISLLIKNNNNIVWMQANTIANRQIYSETTENQIAIFGQMHAV